MEKRRWAKFKLITEINVCRWEYPTSWNRNWATAFKRVHNQNCIIYKITQFSLGSSSTVYVIAIYIKMRSAFERRSIYTCILLIFRGKRRSARDNTIGTCIGTAIADWFDVYYSLGRSTTDHSLRDRVSFDYRIGQWCPMNRHLNRDHSNSVTVPNKPFQDVLVVEFCERSRWPFDFVWNRRENRKVNQWIIKACSLISSPLRYGYRLQQAQITLNLNQSQQRAIHRFA